MQERKPHERTLAELHGDVPLVVVQRDVARNTLLPSPRQFQSRGDLRFTPEGELCRGDIFSAADVHASQYKFKMLRPK